MLQWGAAMLGGHRWPWPWGVGLVDLAFLDSCFRDERERDSKRNPERSRWPAAAAACWGRAPRLHQIHRDSSGVTEDMVGIVSGVGVVGGESGGFDTRVGSVGIGGWGLGVLRI